MAVDHYENFPVASVLCPPRLRPPIVAIYHFARTADDLADEGDAGAAQRLDDLANYRRELHGALAGETVGVRWATVFARLVPMVQAFRLPLPLLDDLLSAFEQDVRYTAEQRHYSDRDELLAYCRLSANPIGRLLLHLYEVDDAQALAQSDAICSALQLINFWQDLSVDLPRQRRYLPLSSCAAWGLEPKQLPTLIDHPNAAILIAEELEFARKLMHSGQDLVHRLPGRAGWELRLVVQGGLRILDKTAALGANCLRQRPRLRAWDLPLLLWRAFRMAMPQSDVTHSAR